ncbi:DUF6440 family protein [Marinilactibacillus psychrotolerans]|uniref:DUF6440 domain-containing protein n=1 Tax=Marinilactibacillus psychrotolerans TaxID=191770 RepID=A0AAV3WTL9_9LACT|nr:DUF6440 family protein [Marinilactibacillus psychrotolerans]GEL67020.1 hypothetical protein MPS01_11750 [Marinilactibacillus psychrotolerans]GEQ36165.1 hypothetical protein M132T_16730 [Marinilactibacillus psychrotolerans]SDC76448.1 hypothetical protein SAMN04488013_10930 [Marinilactibacillus psychrotolerans]
MFNKNKDTNNNRFVVKHTEDISEVGRLIILIDQETGVNYLQSWVGGGSSITPLLDERGEVVIDITPQV